MGRLAILVASPPPRQEHTTLNFEGFAMAVRSRSARTCLWSPIEPSLAQVSQCARVSMQPKGLCHTCMRRSSGRWCGLATCSSFSRLRSNICLRKESPPAPMWHPPSPIGCVLQSEFGVRGKDPKRKYSSSWDHVPTAIPFEHACTV